jgi:hypothetical protein
MTPKQRAYLSFMHDSTDSRTYTAALHACSKAGAVPATAMMLFDGTTVAGREVFVAPAVQVAPVVQAAPVVVPRAASPVEYMEVEQEITPTRVRLNTPPSAQRSLSLQPTTKRQKKKK